MLLDTFLNFLRGDAGLVFMISLSIGLSVVLVGWALFPKGGK